LQTCRCRHGMRSDRLITPNTGSVPNSCLQPWQCCPESGPCGWGAMPPIPLLTKCIRNRRRPKHGPCNWRPCLTARVVQTLRCPVTFGRQTPPSRALSKPYPDHLKEGIHMTTSSIYSRLTEIFREVFDDDDLVVGPALTADDVEEWDSLNHI